MTTPTFTPADIVKFASAKDAVNISAAFDQLIGQKVVDAIDARKKEVAAAMFNEPNPEEENIEASSSEEGNEEAVADSNVDNTVGSEENTEQETEGSNEEAEVTN